MEYSRPVASVVLKLLTAVFMLCFCAMASKTFASDENPVKSRISAQALTWQESLKIEKPNGDVDYSTANYKGVGLGYERQWITSDGGWGLGAWLGTGKASGGGTSTNFLYKEGDISWTMLSLEPLYIRKFDEHIDLVFGLIAYYRTVTWPPSNTFHVTPAREINGAAFAGIDINVTSRMAFRQTIGLNSLTTGPFWRLALEYQL